MMNEELPFHATIQPLRRNGEGKGTYEFARPWCVIGSHEECDIRIHSKDVASLHALLQHADGTFWLSGLDEERTVTIQSSKRVLYGNRKDKIVDNDEFTIAGHTFRFNYSTLKTLQKSSARKASTSSAKKSALRNQNRSKPEKEVRKRRSSLVITDTDEYVVYSTSDPYDILSPEHKQQLSATNHQDKAVVPTSNDLLSKPARASEKKPSQDGKELSTKDMKDRAREHLPPLHPTRKSTRKSTSRKSNTTPNIDLKLDESTSSESTTVQDELRCSIVDEDRGNSITTSQCETSPVAVAEPGEEKLATKPTSEPKEKLGLENSIPKHNESVQKIADSTKDVPTTPRSVSKNQANPKTPRSARERRSLAFIRLSQGLSAVPSRNETVENAEEATDASNQLAHHDPVIGAGKENIQKDKELEDISHVKVFESEKKTEKSNVSSPPGSKKRIPLSPRKTSLNTPSKKERGSSKTLRSVQTSVKKKNRNPVSARRKSVAFARNIELEAGSHYSPCPRKRKPALSEHQLSDLQASPQVVRNILTADIDEDTKDHIPRPSPPHSKDSETESGYRPGPPPTSALARIGVFLYPTRPNFSSLTTENEEDQTQTEPAELPAKNITPSSEDSKSADSTARRLSGTLSYLWRRISSGGVEENKHLERTDEKCSEQNLPVDETVKNNSAQDMEENETKPSTTVVMTEDEIQHITAKASPPVKRRLLTCVYDAASAMCQAVGNGSISDSESQESIDELEKIIAEEESSTSTVATDVPAVHTGPDAEDSSNVDSAREESSADLTTTQDADKVENHQSEDKRSSGDATEDNIYEEEKDDTTNNFDISPATMNPSPKKKTADHTRTVSPMKEKLQSSPTCQNADATSIGSSESFLEKLSEPQLRSLLLKSPSNETDEDNHVEDVTVESNEKSEDFSKNDDIESSPAPETNAFKEDIDGNNANQTVTQELIKANDPKRDDTIDLSKYRERTVKELRKFLKDRKQPVPAVRKEQLIEHIIELNIDPNGNDIVKPQAENKKDTSEVDDNVHLEKRTVSELRAILKQKGDCQWGTKAVLLNRLAPKTERRTRRRSIASEKNICKSCADGETCEGEKLKR